MSALSTSVIACPACTFHNPVSSIVCEMCGGILRGEEPSSATASQGVDQSSVMSSSKAENQENNNSEEVPTTTDANAPAESTSATENANVVRDYICCPHCSTKNSNDDQNCSHCRKPLRTIVDQIISDFHSSSNNFCREVGLKVAVVCPGCGGLSEVPPQTVVKCSACSAVYETTSIGKSASFHLQHLMTSLSRSFSALFAEAPAEVDPSELETPSAPIGILIKEEDPARETVGVATPEEVQSAAAAPSTQSSASSQAMPSSSVNTDLTIPVVLETNERGTGTEDRNGRIVKVEGAMVEL